MNYNYLERVTPDEQTYLNIEHQLIEEFKTHLLNEEIINKNSEVGTVIDVTGKTFANVFVTIHYGDVEKKYDIGMSIKSGFIKFENSNIYDIYDVYYNLHTEVSNRFKLLQEEQRLIIEEQKKQEEERQKAELACQRLKNNVMKSFEKQLNRTELVCDETSDFFYGLGWLTKNVRTLNATLPDYLESPFRQHFGSDTPCRVTNSRHRGPSGYQSQWSWSFSASLKNYDETPTIFREYLNPQGKVITNTSFLWDLIDTYNFKFGKTQDIDSILTTIPKEYKESFMLGFNI